MKPKKKTYKKGIIILVIFLLLGSAGFLAVTKFNKKATGEEYVFTTIKKGDLENVVSSSGTLEPVGTVSVLAQMNGTVEKIYADYNDKVKKNQPLLDLNTELLKIQEKQAEASVLKAKATYEHQQLEYTNNLKLFNKKLLSDFDLHTSKTNLDIAEADLESAEAGLEKIKIELDQYALILSPVTGIVLERDVDVGDSVVSGSTSTSLFTIAKSLSKMEIEADVDELDISKIKTGQKVRFTVDAYPDDTFYGTVREIRLVPTVSDNIVTYTVIVDADNSNEKLLPGMTASLEFIVDEKQDVLLVPNAALRFQPSGDAAKAAQNKLFEARIAQLPPEQQQQARARFEEMRKTAADSEKSRSGSVLGGMRFGPPPGARNGGENGASAFTGGSQQNRKALWYLDDKGELSVLFAETGATDDTRTEIIGQPDLEGKQIIEKVKVKAE